MIHNYPLLKKFYKQKSNFIRSENPKTLVKKTFKILFFIKFLNVNETFNEVKLTSIAFTNPNWIKGITFVDQVTPETATKSFFFI